MTDPTVFPDDESPIQTWQINRLSIDGTLPNFRIQLNDCNIEGLVGLDVRLRPQEIPVVTLELMVDQLSIDIDKSHVDGGGVTIRQTGDTYFVESVRLPKPDMQPELPFGQHETLIPEWQCASPVANSAKCTPQRPHMHSDCKWVAVPERIDGTQAQSWWCDEAANSAHVKACTAKNPHHDSHCGWRVYA